MKLPAGHRSMILLCCLGVRFGLAQGADSILYYQPENIHRFAAHLFQTGDYLRAAGEYQRYLFSFAESAAGQDTVRMKIALCYRRASYFRPAILHYHKVDSIASDWILKGQARYGVALCHTMLAQYDSSNRCIRLDPDAALDAETRADFSRLLVVNSLLERDWFRAADHALQFSLQDSGGQRLANLAAEAVRLRRKSGWQAGIYSAVIPGLGKVYCRRRTEALHSFTTVAIFGWQAYDGFHRGGSGSVKGWIFGSLGTIFYLGNIYGSVVAADIYNEEAENRILTKVRAYVSTSLP